MRPTVPAKYLLPFLFVTLFVIQLGLSMSDLPSMKLMQDIVCKRYRGSFTDELLPEEECRDSAVQRALNRINIGLSVSVTIGSALVAFPLGVLADRIGRVPILAASLFSIFIAQGFGMLVCWRWKVMPLEAIWALGGFLLLGGGQRMAEAMVFTMVADVASKSQRASWFQWVVGAVLAGELAGPFASSRLVESGIWLPLYTSLVLIFVGGVILAGFSPETLTQKPDSAETEDGCNVTLGTKHTIISIFSRPAIFFLPGAVLALPLATTQSNILLRFMPIQFQWQLSKSALLVSLRSAVTLITLLILLPGAVFLCSKRTNWSHLRRDGIFMRTSALCFFVGSTFLTLVRYDEGVIIAGVVVSALGSGLTTLCRSMLVSALHEKNSGLLFGILAIGETTSLLCCAIAMGALFDVALVSWIGYPFLLGAILAIGIFAASVMHDTFSRDASSSSEQPTAVLAVSEPAEKVDGTKPEPQKLKQ